MYKQNNNNNSKNIDENKDKEENDKTKTIDLNDDNQSKISFCHYLLRKGVDIDITNFKCFTCKEQINSKILLFTKQYSKTNTLLFIDENFMYLSKDVIINKKNENIRRISEIYDLNQLFNYSVEKKKTDLNLH